MMVNVTERKVSQYMTENQTLVLPDVEFNFVSSNKNMIGNFVKKYNKEAELSIGEKLFHASYQKNKSNYRSILG